MSQLYATNKMTKILRSFVLYLENLIATSQVLKL